MKAATHLFSSFILGVAVWAFWLRDSDYYWDETLGSWQGPYSEAQVVGCVLTYALMVAVLSTRLNPVLVTVGMASGFWVAWNLQAATADGTGLFLVGSVLVGLALLVGGVIASGAGYAARRLVQRLRSPDRRR